MPHHYIGLLVTLALGILVAPLAAHAQAAKKGPTTGVVLSWSASVVLSWSASSEPDWKQRSAFLQELRTLGWQEGENLTVEYRWTAGQLYRGSDLAAELVRLPVDVILVQSRSLIQAA